MSELCNNLKRYVRDPNQVLDLSQDALEPVGASWVEQFRRLGKRPKPFSADYAFCSKVPISPPANALGRHTNPRDSYRGCAAINNLKSYFVMTYMMMAASIMVIALCQILFRGLSLTWLGALFTAVPFLGFFVWTRYVKYTPRSSPHLPILTIITLGGLGLAMYAYLQGEGIRYPGFGLAAAGIGAIGFVLYVNWYSLFNRCINSKLSMGKQIPRFEVQNRDGETVCSDVLLGKPALLLFYRGGWCPICMAHVDEVASRYRELIERGVQIALISPQPHDLTRRVADMYDVAFNFWVDVDNRAAEALDIVNKDGVPAGVRNTYGSDTVLPTAIIIDAEGKIIFTDQTSNYRVRPNPDLFIEALSVHGY